MILRSRKRRAYRKPDHTVERILAWADLHYARKRSWPSQDSGRVIGATDENWQAIDMALRCGHRGLPGSSSLAQLLAEHRGVRNRKRLPPLTAPRILEWADNHRQRTGKWPKRSSGPIKEAPGETWLGVESALFHGARGWSGGTTLARFLAKHRGARNKKSLPLLKERQIFQWAKAHWLRTGRWPNEHAGPIMEAPGEVWKNIDMALRQGYRGLPGGSSVYRLLASLDVVGRH